MGQRHVPLQRQAAALPEEGTAGVRPGRHGRQHIHQQGTAGNILRGLLRTGLEGLHRRTASRIFPCQLHTPRNGYSCRTAQN